jgi:hypothetical protein
VLTFIAVTLITGGDLGIPRLAVFFSPRTSVQLADEYDFDIGRNRVFANMGGSIAAVGTLGLQVLDYGGRETLRDSFRMTQPAIVVSNGYCIAFDIGGTSVRVFNNSSLLTSIETNGTIVSASINQNSWFCVTTQEGGGTKGTVTVYNDSGAAVYEVSLGSGYVLSAVLSPDNRSLAVLNLTEYGSRINFYHGIVVDKDEPDGLFLFPDGLIIDISYISGSELLVISTNALLLVDTDGIGKALQSYYDKRLGGYAYSDDVITIHLFDYSVGHRGNLINLLADGTILGEVRTDREIISMSSHDGSLIILRSDGLTFFNKALEESSASEESASTAGASRVLALAGGVALATSDNSAVVVRIEEEH